MVGDVRGPQRVEALAARASSCGRLTASGSVPPDNVAPATSTVTASACGDDQPVAVRRHLAAAGLRTGPRDEAQAPVGRGHRGAALDLADQRQTIPAVDTGRGIPRPCQPQPHRHGAGPVRADAHHEDVVDGRGEDLARVGDALHGVGHARDAGREIELARVALDDRAHVAPARRPRVGRARRRRIGLDQEVGERLVRLEALRATEEVALGERRGFGVPAGKEQAPHLGQVRQRVGTGRIAREAVPEGVVVQRQPLLFDAAEDHRAEVPVAHGQRLEPLAGRAVVPQGLRGMARRRRGGLRARAIDADRRERGERGEERRRGRAPEA